MAVVAGFFYVFAVLFTIPYIICQSGKDYSACVLAENTPMWWTFAGIALGIQLLWKLLHYVPAPSSTAKPNRYPATPQTTLQSRDAAHDVARSPQKPEYRPWGPGHAVTALLIFLYVPAVLNIPFAIQCYQHRQIYDILSREYDQSIACQVSDIGNYWWYAVAAHITWLIIRRVMEGVHPARGVLSRRDAAKKYAEYLEKVLAENNQTARSLRRLSWYGHWKLRRQYMKRARQAQREAATLAAQTVAINADDVLGQTLYEHDLARHRKGRRR